MDRYEGQYVAIVGRSFVACGNDAERVYEKACKTNPDGRILIGQVPIPKSFQAIRFTTTTFDHIRR